MAEKVGKDIGALNEQQMLSHCNTVKSRLKDVNHDKHEVQRKSYEYYRSTQRYLKAKMKDKKGKSNFIVPAAYRQVEVLRSVMQGNRPKIFAEFEPENEMIAKRAVEFINAVMWGKDEIDYENKMDIAESWRLITGTSIEKVGWLKQFEEVEEQVVEGGQVLPFTRKVRKVVKNTPEVKVVVPMRFFVGDVYVTDMEKQVELCEEIPMRLSQIRALGDAIGPDGEPVFKNLERLDATMVDEIERNEDVVEYQDAAGTNQLDEPDNINSHDPKFRLEQYWFSPGWLVTIIPDMLELQRVRMKEPPWVRKVFVQDTHLFWGTGIIEPNIASFDEKNEYRNLRLAVRKRFYGNVMVINEKELVDQETDMVPKDAWIIRAKGDPNRAVNIAPVPQSPSLMEEEAIIDRDIEQNGVSNLLAPSPEDAPETATGTIQLQTAAAGKFNKPRGRLEAGVERIVEKIAKLCQEHLVENREFYVNEDGYLSKRYINDSYFETPEGIMPFRFRVELGSTAPLNEATEIKNRLLIWKMGANDPYIEQAALRKWVFEAVTTNIPQGLIKDIPAIPQPAAEQQAQQAFEAGKKAEIDNEVLKEQLKDTLSDVEKKRDDLDNEPDAETRKGMRALRSQLNKAERGQEQQG